MFNWFMGFFTMAALVYAAVAVASWYDDTDTTCWYCRVFKAMNWPYEMYKSSDY